MPCNHIAESVRNVTSGVPVHKEECSFCYNGVDVHHPDPQHADPNCQVSQLLSAKQNYPKTGHNVCFLCFTGGCFSPYGHMFRHYEATKHHTVLNILKKVTPSTTPQIDTSTIKSLNELAAHVSNQPSENVEYTYTGYCITCDELLPIDAMTSPTLYASLQSVISSDSGLKLQHFAVTDTNAAVTGGFDAQAVSCQHTHELESNHDEVCAINLSLQVSPDDMVDDATQPTCTRSYIPGENNPNHKTFLGDNFLPDLSTAAKPLSEAETAYYDSERGKGCYNIYKCQDCDINKNLWLCMTCGFLGCARRDYDGSGGNNHAVAHNEATGHPLVIKIATVTKDSGDIWCYACNDPVKDDNLASHLSVFNLDTNKLLKSEQSLEDMQLQRNITAQFASAYNKDGFSKPLVFGPLHTGMQNFGNSCYIASVLQLFFRTPGVFNRYYIQGLNHIKTCRNGRPGTCMFCNMYKLTHGLFSGDYSPTPDNQRLLTHIQAIFPALQQLRENQSALVSKVSATTSMCIDDQSPNQLKREISMVDDDDDDDDRDTSCPHHLNKKQRIGGEKPQSEVSLDEHTPAIQTASGDKLQTGITVHSVRKLLCNNHPVFGNHSQQDAHEFLLHLRDSLHTFETTKCPEAAKLNPTTTFPNDPTNALSLKGINDPLGFQAQESIICSECGHSSYKFSTQYDLGLELSGGTAIPDDELTEREKADANVAKERYDIKTCLSAYSQPRQLVGYKCPGCTKYSTSLSMSSLLTAPQYFTIQVRRFIIDHATWSVKKNNGKLLNASAISLEEIAASTPPDLSVLAAAASSGSAQAVSSGDDAKYMENATNIAEMCQTPLCRAIHALKQTSNNPDLAVEMIFSDDSYTEHIIACKCPGQGGQSAQPTQVPAVHDPVFVTVGAQDKVLFSSTDRTQRLPLNGLQYRLVGFINHLGSTPQNGHYVTHINASYNEQLAAFQPNKEQPAVLNATAYVGTEPPTDFAQIQPCVQTLQQQPPNSWICYNDAKVFINDEPPMDDAYVLMYQRID